MEETLIWLPTSKALARSGGYVTAVIEASVGGGNCRKGKLSGWAGFFKMKAGEAFAAMRTPLRVKHLYYGKSSCMESPRNGLI